MKGKNKEMEQQARELVNSLMSDAARKEIPASLLRQGLSDELCNGSQK